MQDKNRSKALRACDNVYLNQESLAKLFYNLKNIIMYIKTYFKTGTCKEI